MPRLYLPPQRPQFAGAQARVDQQQQRQQKLQHFSYMQQSRQAGQMQRQAQRAAQQQQAFQAQQLQADRDFQMQRDRFGAQRDYGMQERRLGAAAEEARLGREFQMDQADVRFGQQQDLAMQEQDYRLQQLDIAAENQYLSTEQQAQIQRERDILVNEMQRAAAAEGRFEQFGYGQMAADAAARRPLSVAERQRLRFSDELDARSQGRGADIAGQQITQRHELGMEATRQRIDQEAAVNERLGKISHEQAIKLRTLIGDQAFDAKNQDHVNALDRAVFSQELIDRSKQNDRAREKETQLTEAREAEIGYRIRQLRLSGRFGAEDSPEFKAQVQEIIRKVGALSDAEIGVGPSSQEQFDRAKVNEGGAVLVPTGNGYMKVHEAQPQFTTPGGETVKPNQWFPLGNQKVAFSRSGQLITAPPDPEQRTRDAVKSYLFKKRLDYIHSEVETTDALGNKTSRPRFTHMEQQRMLQELKRREFQTTDTPAPGGGGWSGPQGWDPGVETGPLTDQSTGDTQTTDRWGHTPEQSANEFNKALQSMRDEPINRAAAQQTKTFLEETYRQGRIGEVPVGDWSPFDRARYYKAVLDLKAEKDDEQVGMPASAFPNPVPRGTPVNPNMDLTRPQGGEF